MASIPISTQQVLRIALVFAALIVVFAVLSFATGWPDKQGWGLVVVLSAVIAALPIFGPILEFIRDSGAVIDIKGVKLDFSASAAHSARLERANFDDYPGMPVSDSNAASIAEAAETAQSAPVVVVDLGTGQSWYPTRLFALAAAADTLKGARAIVIAGQRGGVRGSFLGWIAPEDAVTAFCNRDPRYREALNHALTILHHLRLSGGDAGYPFPPSFDGAPFLAAYRTSRDLALVPALIASMQSPPAAAPGMPPTAPLELQHHPEWLGRDDAERLLDPWLIRDHVYEAMPGAEKRTLLARAGRGFLAVTEENGTYRGMIDVAAAIRREVFNPPQAKV